MKNISRTLFFSVIALFLVLFFCGKVSAADTNSTSDIEAQANMPIGSGSNDSTITHPATDTNPGNTSDTINIPTTPVPSTNSNNSSSNSSANPSAKKVDPSNNGFMEYILVVILLGVSMKFVLSAAGEAGKYVNQGVSALTGGKVKGVGAGIKSVGSAASKATVGRWSANAGMKIGTGISKLKEEKKGVLGKTVGGTLRMGTMMKQKIKEKDAKTKLDYEQAQKDLKKSISENELASLSIPKAYELKGSNEEVEKKANQYGKIAANQMSNVVKGALFDKNGAPKKKMDLQDVAGALSALKSKMEAGGDEGEAADKELRDMAVAFGVSDVDGLVNTLRTGPVNAAAVEKFLGGAISVQGNNIKAGSTPLTSSTANALSKRKYQEANQDKLVENFSSGFKMDDAIGQMSDDDIDRALKNIQSAPATNPNRATALANVRAVQQRRINTLSAGHEESIREIYNSPLLAGSATGKANVLLEESNRISRINSLLGSDEEQARKAIESAYKVDLKGATKVQMQNIMKARQEALNKVRTNP